MSLKNNKPSKKLIDYQWYLPTLQGNQDHFVYSLKTFVCTWLDDGCGPYGHEMHLREICAAAWKQPPQTEEMTKDEFDEWQQVERQLQQLRREKELKQMDFFRQMVTNQGNRS